MGKGRLKTSLEERLDYLKTKNVNGQLTNRKELEELFVLAGMLQERPYH